MSKEAFQNQISYRARKVFTKEGVPTKLERNAPETRQLSANTRSRRSRLYGTGEQAQATPREFFYALDEIFRFGVDVASQESLSCCPSYFDEETDGLKQSWAGTAWCNPPWRRLQAFLRKALCEVDRGHFSIVLCPIRTHTLHWRQLLAGNHNVAAYFYSGRLKFGNSKTAYPHPLCLLLFIPDGHLLPANCTTRLERIGLIRWGGNALASEATTKQHEIGDIYNGLFLPSSENQSKENVRNLIQGK